MNVGGRYHYVRMTSSIPWMLRATAARTSLTTLAGTPLSGLSDEDLLQVTVEAEALGRLVDALRVSTAGEVADRSRWSLGHDGLGYRYGNRKPAIFLSQLLRTTQKEAARRVKLGSAVRPPTGLDGVPLPSSHPRVEKAITSGDLNVDAALAIVGAMDDASRTASWEDIDAATEVLVATALDENADIIRVMSTVWREALDPDGAEPRDEKLRLKRAFRLGTEKDGLTPFSGALDPLRAALIRGALDDANKPGVMPRFLSEEDRVDATVEVEQIDGTTVRVPKDTRTKDQRQCDVLVGLVEAGLGNDGTKYRHTTEVVVVVDSRDLPPGVLDAWEAADPIDPHLENCDDPRTTELLFDGDDESDDDVDGTPDSDAGLTAGDIPEENDVHDGPAVDHSDHADDGNDGNVTTGINRTPFEVEVELDLDADNHSTDTSTGTGDHLDEDFTLDRPPSGVGWIDGVAEPISTATVVEEICSHGYRLLVTGPDGEILHLSRRHRYYTAQQVRALAVRDGGCVWPGCQAPPAWCHAHHVTEFENNGKTTVKNGVLLCSHHHHMLHNFPYRLRMREGHPELLAPVWLDPDQTWVPLGKSRRDMLTTVKARR
jgi:hypothetical protein